MKITITRRVTEEVEVGSIYLKIPVEYEEEDIPNDFPFRTGDVWDISFTPDGQIIGWAEEHEEWFAKNQGNENMEGLVFNFQMKVCDAGHYEVRDSKGVALLVISDDYVPHSLIPGEFGDYVELDISSTGEILNLNMDIEEAFRRAAEDEDDE